MRKIMQKMNELPLVAIDMGSDCIRAMAAERISDDILHIQGVETSNKHACVERGVVVNTGNASWMIGEILKKLANRIGVKHIPSAFACLGGQSMQIYTISNKRDLIHKTEITPALLDDIRQKCLDKVISRNPHIAVLGMVPQYYTLDHVDQEEIVPGQKATELEVHYTFFVGKPALKEKVEGSFERTIHISLESSFVRMEALLSAFAQDEPSMLTDGCAVMDMGAQTTTLSVYKGGEYLMTKVVDKGGWDISRFIEQQGPSLQYAEALKCQYGWASEDLVDKNLTLDIPSYDGSERISVTSKELAETIRMKLDEIVDPLMQELKKYEERIPALYITGGASMLQGMEEYLQRKTKLQVLYGSHAGLLDETTPDEYCSPVYSSLVGTLILGSDYREEHKEAVLSKPKSIIKIVENGMLDIFSADQDE